MRPCEAERLVPKAALRATHGIAQRFMRREDGTITVFAMAVFVLMVGVGGIAVDLMRFEAQRSQLQSTLDRAVLAAASLNQQRDAEGVVRNYFETAGFENYRLSVDVERNINFRRVAVEAEVDVQTLFMKLFGQRVLTSFASGAAEERIPKVEVSLVLDISGSMMFLDRMTNLKPAAREFVTSILEANDGCVSKVVEILWRH
uniref:TadE/TadG family type IV pilus assembly protein n=1 Tax=Roseicyclus sp. TaxID=1914329 RepID=UPI001BCAC1FF